MSTISPASLHCALVAAGLLSLTLIVSACGSGSTASVPHASPTPGRRIAPASSQLSAVAVVSGTPITGAEFATAVAQEHVNLSNQVKQSGGQMPPIRQMRAAVLNSLIDTKVVALYANMHGITVTPGEVQVQFARAQANSGGPTAFAMRLTAYGLTLLAAKARLRDGLLLQRVQQHVLAQSAEVEEVEARHILVKSQALANQIYAQLQRNPTMFAALAKQYSIDSGSAQNGGELGFFPHGVMVTPFDHAAFAQPVGHIGKPIQSSYGYHIIQVEAHKRVPLTQLDQQTQQVYLQHQQAAFAEWLVAERTRDHVRILTKT